MKFTAGVISILLVTLYFVHWNWLASWLGAIIIIPTIFVVLAIIAMALGIFDEFAHNWS